MPNFLEYKKKHGSIYAPIKKELPTKPGVGPRISNLPQNFRWQDLIEQKKSLPANFVSKTVKPKEQTKTEQILSFLKDIPKGALVSPQSQRVDLFKKAAETKIPKENRQTAKQEGLKKLLKTLAGTTSEETALSGFLPESITGIKKEATRGYKAREAGKQMSARKKELGLGLFDVLPASERAKITGDDSVLDDRTRENLAFAAIDFASPAAKGSKIAKNIGKELLEGSTKKTALTKELTPLIEEAKKYKSADEFVASKKKLYHGTDADFKEFDLDKTPAGDIWFSESKRSISSGESGATGIKNIMERYVDIPESKLANWDQYDKYSLEELRDMGYKGVKLKEKGSPTDWIVFDPKLIKTKSQLTDIFNKAKGSTQKVGQKELRELPEEISMLGKQEGIPKSLKSSPLDSLPQKQSLTLESPLKSTFDEKLIDELSPKIVTTPLLESQERKLLEAGRLPTSKEARSIFKKTGDAVAFEDVVKGGREKPIELPTDIGTQIKESLKRQVDILKLGSGRPRTKMEAKSIFKKTGSAEDFENIIKGGRKKPIELPSDIERFRPDQHGVTPPIRKGAGIQAPKLDFSKWKDKPALGLSRETFVRNIERVAPEADAKKVLDFVMDPIRKNETSKVKWKTQEKKDIIDKVVKGLNIKGGRKDSKLLQEFGEKGISLNNLKNKTDNWENIVKAEKIFRKKYDTYLVDLNKEVVASGGKAIPARKDYFRHMQEGSLLGEFGDIFKKGKNELPAAISGITHKFKAGRPFTTAELKRVGGETKVDAIRGIENYIDSVANTMFHGDSVNRIRAIENYLRSSGGVGSAAEKLPNLTSNISQFADLTAGKKAALDIPIEDLLGRNTRLIEKLAERTGANMVIGNISSAITNLVPFTQSIATMDGIAAGKGLVESLLSPLKKIKGKSFADIDGLESDYLNRRFLEMKTGKISPNIAQKASKKAAMPFQGVDEFTSKAITAGKYYELTGKGMDPKKAMKEADDYAIRVSADRSVGEKPNLFNTRALKIISQFQLEVNNTPSFLLRDIPKIAGGSKIKHASMLGQFVLYSYLFNSLYEKTTGRRIQIDPINAALILAGKTPKSESKDIIGRLQLAGEEIANNLPFSSVITGGGRFPIGAGLPSFSDVSRGESTLGKELLKPATFILPPFGGSQAKKTIEGAKALKEGAVFNKGGYKNYDVSTDPANAARALLLGRSRTKEAKEYYEYTYFDAMEDMKKAYKNQSNEEVDAVIEKAKKYGIDGEGVFDDVHKGVTKQNRVEPRKQATIIIDQMNQLPLEEAKRKYLEMKNNGEITPEIEEQIIYMSRQ